MIEYHDILNPKLWNNNQLIPEVKNKLIEIYQTFINKLKENEIPIEVIDVLLLGSNAAYNYTDYSDIDLHIIADFNDIPLNDTLTQLFYNNEKSKFNDDYDISIKGLPVELYIEDIDAGNKSEGVYSLLQDKWLKFPEYNPPQEVDYSFLLDVYKNKISEAINSNNSENIKKVINEIRMLRKLSLMEDGIYSKGNLVFKELRNDGSIESLYNKLHELVSQELSLESKQLIESTNITKLINELNSLKVCNPKDSYSHAKYELIKEYEKVLKQFPIGTILSHKMEAGTEKFTKLDNMFWEHIRMPWKKIDKCSEFDIAKWLADRGNISRGNIELIENKKLIESENTKRIDLFEFDWENGSINDNIIKHLKDDNKIWRYNHYFQLEIKVAGNWYVIKNEVNNNHVKVYYEFKETLKEDLLNDIYNKISNIFKGFKSIEDIDEFKLNSANIILKRKENIKSFITYCKKHDIKYEQDHNDPLIFIIYF